MPQGTKSGYLSSHEVTQLILFFIIHLKFVFEELIRKFNVKPSNRLPIPPNIHGIPLNPNILGAYAAPKANTLIPLFLVLFSLIFKASKA